MTFCKMFFLGEIRGNGQCVTGSGLSSSGGCMMQGKGAVIQVATRCFSGVLRYCTLSLLCGFSIVASVTAGCILVVAS